jgi:hypothetical protein
MTKAGGIVSHDETSDFIVSQGRIYREFSVPLPKP